MRCEEESPTRTSHLPGYSVFRALVDGFLAAAFFALPSAVPAGDFLAAAFFEAVFGAVLLAAAGFFVTSPLEALLRAELFLVGAAGS